MTGRAYCIHNRTDADLNPIGTEISMINEVVVLCWNTPATSDRRAHKIAAFLGAEAIFVSLTSATLADGTSIRKLVPKCTCLIVDAETLAKASDAMPARVSGLRSLIDLSGHVFIYGFQPTDRHAAILRALSSGGLLGVQRVLESGAKFYVSEGHREWCGQFSGLAVDAVDPTRANSFLEGTQQQCQAVIIRAGYRPFFVRIDLDGPQVFFLACDELVDLDEKVGREVRILAWFCRLVPLMMFLRGALGNRVWHNDHPRACFIIDDPLLTNHHGFLEYRRLLEIMRRKGFSTCIAFIPWNYRRSSKEVVELLSSTCDLPFLCVHGCDHIRAEFAATHFELLRAKAQLALERMRAHRQLFGAPFDDIMVFPQGLFSAEALKALKASGYLAAVNNRLYPSTMPDTMAVRDVLGVAVTRFADFPLFGRRYPQDLAEFAFDLFMGKPALAYEHHGYFRTGYKALEAFVSRLNTLDEQLEWTNLGVICSRACLTRTAPGGDVYVRFYTNRFWLKNSGSHPRRYILLQRLMPDAPSPTVTIDGLEWDRKREDDDLKIDLSLDAGQTADIRVLSRESNSVGFSWRQTDVHNARVRVRRVLCEFRDNYVDTSRVLSRIVSTLWNLRSRRTIAVNFASQCHETDHSSSLKALPLQHASPHCLTVSDNLMGAQILPPTPDHKERPPIVPQR